MSKILQKMIVLKIHEILTVLIFFLTNSPLSFQNTRDVSNGLSDFDKMVVSVKMTFQKILLGRAYTMKFFFTTLKSLFRKKSVEIFQQAECVSCNIIQFVHTIKFHSYDYDNVSFIERINNFHFACHIYCNFKSCLKISQKRSQLRC